MVGWWAGLYCGPTYEASLYYVSQICHKLDTEIIVAAQGKESWSVGCLQCWLQVVECDGCDPDQWYQDWFWLDNIRARLLEEAQCALVIGNFDIDVQFFERASTRAY